MKSPFLLLSHAAQISCLVNDLIYPSVCTAHSAVRHDRRLGHYQDSGLLLEVFPYVWCFCRHRRVSNDGSSLVETAVKLAKQRLDRGSDFLNRMTGRVRNPGTPSGASQHPLALSCGRSAKVSSSSRAWKTAGISLSAQRPVTPPPLPPHRIQGGVAHLSPNRPTWVCGRRVEEREKRQRLGGRQTQEPPEERRRGGDLRTAKQSRGPPTTPGKEGTSVIKEIEAG